MKPGRDDVAAGVELAIAVEAVAHTDDAAAVDGDVGAAARALPCRRRPSPPGSPAQLPCAAP